MGESGNTAESFFVSLMECAFQGVELSKGIRLYFGNANKWRRNDHR